MRWFSLKILMGALAALLAVDGCASPRKPLGAGGPIVRVQLIGSATQVTLQVTKPPRIRATTGAASVPDLAADTPIGITLAPDGWHVGGANAGGGDLLISPASVGSVAIDGKAYRGTFRLIATGNGTFDVINDVDIESYLKGVLAAEMLAKWEIEAYKAQAVAARTYALYEMQTNPQGKTFDVFDDTRSQVYKGIGVETDKSRFAVDQTRGVVVAYAPPGKEPRIFKAYFSACCGGIATNVTDVFELPYIPPLGDRNMGTTCAQSPRFNWGPVTLTKDELTRRVQAWGTRRNNPVRESARIESIDPAFANTFGRPTKYALTDAKGARYLVPAEGMRQAINIGAGKTLAYSGFLTAVADRDNFTFTGRGSGHGVGLCQYCCQYQALAGMTYEKILALNYPQSVRVRAY